MLLASCPDKRPVLCPWTNDLLKKRESNDIVDGGFALQRLRKTANLRREIEEYVPPIDQSNKGPSNPRETTAEHPIVKHLPRITLKE